MKKLNNVSDSLYNRQLMYRGASQIRLCSHRHSSPKLLLFSSFSSKIIDFDRVCGISGYKVRSDHYQLIPPTEQLLSSGSALDFKQLGMLIAQVMNPEMRSDKWNWESLDRSSLKVNLIN